MRWTLLLFPLLAFAQEEMKELPKINLFPPGGLRAVKPPPKNVSSEAPREMAPGKCSVPLVNVEPPRTDSRTMMIPIPKEGSHMPQVTVPAPPCNK